MKAKLMGPFTSLPAMVRRASPGFTASVFQTVTAPCKLAQYNNPSGPMANPRGVAIPPPAPAHSVVSEPTVLTIRFAEVDQNAEP